MKQIPYIPDTAPFTPEQRAWLNGFLAGLYANGAPDSAAIAAANGAPAKTGEPLLILFGSQTGSAEGLAKRVAKESEKRGFAPRVLALNDYEQADLARGGKILIVSSTWGDGEPPDNAVNFWSWLNSAAAPRLEKLHFAVLGLGDKNYADFCGAAKKFDERLAALGAHRLAPRGECDADYEAPAREWLDRFWDKLDGTTATASVPATNGHAQPVEEKKRFDKKNPFPARLLRNVLLNKPGSSKEVRHYEISLAGSGLNYEVGDALGVIPANCTDLVNHLLAALHCDGEESVNVEQTAMPLRLALTRHFDITRPSSEFLAFAARIAPAAEFAPLLASDRAADLKQWLRGRDLLDVIRLLPQPVPLEELTPLLRKLAPRLYSIASSPKAHPGEVHLTVSAVRYECFGRGRKGVASTFLADRAGDSDQVKVFVQPSHGFKPPPRGDTPMIMVGPGTGIAPFRGFLEERHATGATGKHWLLFGDQKRDVDFLYEEQLTRWHQAGFLTRLDLAFSRDQAEKIYVQNRMLENGAELWSWLEGGAHFYVCGDASRMAKDVDAALHRIVEDAGGKSADDARAYVARLKSEKRYQRDVY
jgi:sulfite reductase (NADPH) flavoprotein alpha-component